jgi:hypothetical protein
MSETAASRDILAPYCSERWGCDLGFGGDPVVEHAITFDMPRPYTSVGGSRQILKGDCRDLSCFQSGSMDWLYSSHLLEDFSYTELREVILPEWRRVLRPGGLLVTNCPDQQRFLSHCARTGQPGNNAHLEQDFSLETFERYVLCHTGPWQTILREPEHGAYSWLLVVRKMDGVNWDEDGEGNCML